MNILASQWDQFRWSSVEFLFPSACSLCGSAVSTECRIQICEDCLCELNLDEIRRCEVCSAVVGPNLKTENGCQYCRNDRFAFGAVTSLGNYDGALKQAVLRGKYHHETRILSSLTELLFRLTSERFSDASISLVVPIPHHWTERFRSCHPASTTIANQLSRLLKVRIDRHILCKRKRTPKQHSLQPTARRKNLQDAFKVNRNVDLTGLSVLLVDDVLTTGTTCQRATRTLLQAGAEEVRVAVLARGIGA